MMDFVRNDYIGDDGNKNYEFIKEAIKEYQNVLLYCYRKLEEYVYYCLRCIGKYIPYSLDDFIVFQQEEDNELHGFTIGVVYPKPKGDMVTWGGMDSWNILFYNSFTFEFSMELGLTIISHDSFEEYKLLYG